MTQTPDDAIAPDTKDWTWVLERPCPECGLAVGAITGPEVPGRIRAAAVRWAEVLRRADVAARPAPGVWSPLEYACHVRDVCGVMAQRARLMLDVEDPTFPDWDQDAAARAARYGEQDPGRVAADLGVAADDAAGLFAGVAGEQWRRRGVRSNGSGFSIETLAQYFLHDVEHHLHDVGG